MDSPEDIERSDRIEIDRFCELCHKGDLASAKILLDKESSIFLAPEEQKVAGTSPSSLYLKIQRYNSTNYIFYTTCGYGHLEVAKWFKGLFPNICFYEESPHKLSGFYCAGIMGHIEVLQWMLSEDNSLYEDSMVDVWFHLLRDLLEDAFQGYDWSEERRQAFVNVYGLNPRHTILKDLLENMYMHHRINAVEWLLQTYPEILQSKVRDLSSLST